MKDIQFKNDGLRLCVGAYSSGACFPPLCFCLCGGRGGPDAFSQKKQAPHEAEPVSGAVMPPPAEPEGGNEGARGESFPPDVFSAFPAFTGERGGYGYRGRG